MRKLSVFMIILLFAVFAAHAAGPVISAISATPDYLSGSTKTTKLSVTATGATTLTYVWDTVWSAAPAKVTFSAKTSKSTNATVSMAGWYLFHVKVKDKQNPPQTTEASVSIMVEQTLTKIDIWPPTLTTSFYVIRKFTATGWDQFGNYCDDMPAINWSLSGGGQMYSDGNVLTGFSTGTWTITAQSQDNASINNTATITVANPSVTTAQTYIKNVFIIMQENRTFDNYFGTYGGTTGFGAAANGFARIGLKPVHHHSSGTESEYPHGHGNAVQELATTNYDYTGRYLTQYAFMRQNNLSDYNNDCFGYHNGDASDLFNYWVMADTFVLQDAMFEACKSYSKPSHCYLVSGWSAGSCAQGQNPTCYTTDIDGPSEVGGKFLWHSIAGLLPAGSWKYYKCLNFNRSCANCDASCFTSGSLSQNDFWLPMSKFTDANGQADVDVNNLITNLASHTDQVPKVCWIVPGIEISEHPQGEDARKGMKYVTSIVKAIMNSTIWNNCAIFISWDDWGGHYDHVIPPYQSTNDNEGWGLRVPGLMLSPYAKKASSGPKKGWVDHEQYSHEAYLKLIEDLFCGGNRISTSDGRPKQPETMYQQGNLLNEFDFGQTARTTTTPFRNKLVCKTY